MKLHSPKFEKALRRDVKRTLEAALQRRGPRKHRKPHSFLWIVRPVIAVLLGWFVLRMTVRYGNNLTAGLAVLTLWAAVFVCIQAQGLANRLYESDDIVPLYHLPISLTQIFRWELQKFLKRSPFSLLDLLVAFGVLAWALEPAWMWAAAGAAVVTWLTLLALGFLCAAYLPWVPPLASISGFVAALGIVFLGKHIDYKPLFEWFGRSAPIINLVVPTGWAVSLFELPRPGADPWLWALLIPIAGLLAAAPFALRSLRSRYKIDEPVYSNAPDLIPGEEPEIDRESLPDPPRVGLSEIEEIVRTRKFLVAHDWRDGGWTERWLWKWLTERERNVADFTFPEGFPLSECWQRIARNVVIFCAVGLVLGIWFPTFKLWLLGVGLFITTCQAAGMLLGSGRAFQTLGSSGVAIPFHAAYPIGYHELSRVLLKLYIVQLPFGLLYATTIAMLFAAAFNWTSVLAAGVFGLKVTCIVTAYKRAQVALGFSGHSDDRSRRGGVGALFWLACGLIGAGLGVSNQFLSWSYLAAAIGVSYAIGAIYGRLYNSSRFDAMVPSR